MGGFGAEFVADRDRAGGLPVDLDEDGGGPGLLHPVDVAGEWACLDPAGTPQP